jgi:hypothetical protein
LDSSLIDLLKDAAGLTDYAVDFRYVDAPREPDEAEALSALNVAERLSKRIDALLAAS